jgi:Tfp pilus assembly pilus retraction ATPase PilT
VSEKDVENATAAPASSVVPIDRGRADRVSVVAHADNASLERYMKVLEGYSDIHLCISNLSRSMVFHARSTPSYGKGPMKLPTEHLEMARVLLDYCRDTGKRDFMIELGRGVLRGRLDDMPLDSDWYKLRITEPEIPRLDDLPSPLPSAVFNMLLSPHLTRGGLIYICGAPGAGKTTSGSATIASRLMKYGGVACTLENPPERFLNGWHGTGYCYQGALKGDTEDHWAEAFRNGLRSQPAGTILMLYVGEVRDGESARAMLQAAANGFLVVATGFGTDVITGLQSLCKRASSSGEDLSSVQDHLAATLRLVVHQELAGGVVKARFLASTGSESGVANRIRTGQFVHLGNDFNYQSNVAMKAKNEDLFELLKRAAP